MLYHFKKKIDRFPKNIFKYVSFWYDKIVYKKSILKSVYEVIFYMGVYFSSASICLLVNHQYAFENGLFQLTGGTNCLFATLI